MTFVIKEHRPWRRLVIQLVIVGLWLVSGWFAYEAGLSQSSRDLNRVESQRKVLQQELDESRTLNDELQIRVSQLQRTSQIDREAKIELAREVKNFQDLRAELQEELSFYRGIISPDGGKTGLRVYRFSIDQAEDNLCYYEMLLTKNGKNDHFIEGRVKVAIQGVLQGKEKSFDLSKVRVTGG